MDLGIFQQYGPALLRGFSLTVLCWLFGTVLGMALGLVIALAQRYGPKPLRWLIQAYVEVIRGTPFLVQLFVLYYGGPMIGLRLDALPAGLLGLTIYGSPYFAVIANRRSALGLSQSKSCVMLYVGIGNVKTRPLASPSVMTSMYAWLMRSISCWR